MKYYMLEQVPGVCTACACAEYGILKCGARGAQQNTNAGVLR
jgi:hypothetical protein